MTTSAAYQSINPATGELIASYPGISDRDVDPIVKKSRETSAFWRRLSMADRASRVAKLADLFEQNVEELAADQKVNEDDETISYIQRRPVGPLLGIMPWNFPYYQIARFAAPNLVLGNTIILKHAES